jgi:LysM repeat protein
MRLKPPPPASLHHCILRLVVLAAVGIVCGLHWQTARAEEVIHIVQPGENLFRIGLKYGVSWVAIMNANGLPDTTIYVGQSLVIPGAAEGIRAEGTPAAGLPAPTEAAPTETAPAAVAPMPTDPASVAEAPAAPGEGGATYTVQAGDTLFQIAARHGVNFTELAAANSLYNPSLIYPGQTLFIPAGGVAAAAAIPGSASAKKIVISISEQHLYAYENDTQVYSFTASTGMPGADTAPGSYSVLDKIPNAYGANWDLWMPNWLGIYWAGTLENGIHALPILSNGQRLWDGYLGTPVSFGCIILGVEDSQTLYDWAEVGTPVYIRY